MRKDSPGVPVVAQWLTNPTSNHEDAGSFLVSLSGLRIWWCHELWGRLQTQLGSRIAVAMAKAGGYSSNWTPSLGISICCRWGPKKTKKKRQLSRWTVPGLSETWILTPVLQVPSYLTLCMSSWSAVKIKSKSTCKAFNAMPNTKKVPSSFLSISPYQDTRSMKSLRPFWFTDVSSTTS